MYIKERKMLNKLIGLLEKYRLSKNIAAIKESVTLKGQGHKFLMSSVIELRNESSKNDIVLGTNVWMYGVLRSSSKGKIIFGDYTKIGPGSSIVSVNRVEIGNFTAIGNNVQIVDNNNHPIHPEDRLFMRTTPENSKYRDWKYSDNKPIIIGENVWVGANSRINKGVVIGDNAIIAANTVVTKDVPKNSIVAGNPGKIVKTDIDKLPRVFKNIHE